MCRDLLRESLLWRLLHFIASLLDRLPRPLVFRLPGRPAVSERTAERLTFENQTEHALLFRFLYRINAALCSLGQRLRPLWAASVTARCLHRIREKTSQSFFFSGLAAFGMTGVLLALLAFFPLLDAVCKYAFQNSALAARHSEPLLAASFAVLLVRRLRTKEPAKPCLTPATLPLWQFFIVCTALLIAVHPYPQIAFAGWYITVGDLLWFFALTRLLRSREDVLLLCRTAVVLAAAVSLIGVIEYVFAAPIPSTWLEPTETGIRTRAYAIFANPNQLGEYLELMLPLTAGLIYRADRKEEKLLLTVCLFLMLAAALFTMSRGAWLAITVGLLVFALLADRRLLLIFAVCGVCILAVSFVFSRLTFLFSDAFSYSAAKGGRLVRWQTALRYLCQTGEPLLGLGFGMYGGEIANNHHTAASWTYYWVDNYYIRILAESGIIGLVSFCVMQAGVLFCGLRSWARVRRTKDAALAAGLLAGLVGILVHSVFECTFDVRFVSVLYWSFAATLVWLGFLQRDSET